MQVDLKKTKLLPFIEAPDSCNKCLLKIGAPGHLLAPKDYWPKKKYDCGLECINYATYGMLVLKSTGKDVLWNRSQNCLEN